MTSFGRVSNASPCCLACMHACRKSLVAMSKYDCVMYVRMTSTGSNIPPPYPADVEDPRQWNHLRPQRFRLDNFRAPVAPSFTWLTMVANENWNQGQKVHQLVPSTEKEFHSHHIYTIPFFPLSSQKIFHRQVRSHFVDLPSLLHAIDSWLGLKSLFVPIIGELVFK